MTNQFLQQRLFPSLRIEQTAMVHRGQRNFGLHIRQSDLDSACGTYCAAMALALFGCITDVTVLSDRRNGIAGRLWTAAKKCYFDGVDALELASLIESLDTDLRVSYCDGSHRQCLSLVLDQLSKGRLVIVSWMTKNESTHHWTLAIGTEGLQCGRRFVPETILVLDPGADSPQFCAYNGRLTLPSGTTINNKKFIPYSCYNAGALQVRLTGAVVIRAPA
ncbi:MAG: hypothetical protein JWR22_3128 [Herminiimonas sp.]|nr:hypothetical protein [Herminiimonas sp.]